MIVWQRPNLLLLDEPTNHLDLATREALSMALNEFEGTVMLVSHDRSLLRAVCDEFWLVSRGGIAPFDGDLDDYQRYLLDMAKQAREAQREQARAAEAPAPAAAPAVVDRRADAQRLKELNERLRPLKKELAQVEQRMAQLNEQRSSIEAGLMTTQDPARLAQAGRELKAIDQENSELEARWLELTEAIEQPATP
jgi:ATP-binding cassette subfamily F protein 3